MNCVIRDTLTSRGLAVLGRDVKLSGPCPALDELGEHFADALHHFLLLSP